jgi:hypothetical protein
MNRKQRPPGSNAPDDYPPSLDGGEPPSRSDHRIGETQRQNPQSDQIDPSGAETSRRSPEAGKDEQPAP